jgi:hypothetical protein
MTHSRRQFLGATVFLAGAALGTRALAGQNRLPPSEPYPSVPFGQSPEEREQLERNDARRMKENQVKIAKGIQQMKEAVDTLQKELDAKSAIAVFSVAAIRKTEEIEKLARDIRGWIRG